MHRGIVRTRGHPVLEFIVVSDVDPAHWRWLGRIVWNYEYNPGKELWL
jgi:hypothetical protein